MRRANAETKPNRTVAHRVAQRCALLAADEFTVGLVAHAADGPAALLEIGPALVVGLGLVEIDGRRVLVDLVKPELGLLALVSQDICFVEFVQRIDF